MVGSSSFSALAHWRAAPVMDRPLAIFEVFFLVLTGCRLGLTVVHPAAVMALRRSSSRAA